MAFRPDVWIDWNASPRIIWVSAPSTNILVQDIIDTCRVLEAEVSSGIVNPKLLEASGKAFLYNDGLADYYTGIVLKLTNAVIAFADRPGPDYIQCSVTGGDMIAVDVNNLQINPIHPTAFTQIVISTSTAPTLVTVSTNGIGTTAEVAAAVWDGVASAHNIVGTLGEKLNAVGASANPWLTDLTTYTTPGTAGNTLRQAGVDVTAVKSTTDNLTPYFENIISAIDNIHGGVGVNTGAVSFTLTQGTVLSGTFENTHTFNDASHVIRDNAQQFDFEYKFDVDIDSIPTSFTYIGYVEDRHEIVNVSAWNYKELQWEEIGQITGVHENTTFTFPLMRDHVGITPGEIGDVRIRFFCNVISDTWTYTDQMYVSYVKTERKTGYSGHPITATNNTIQLDTDASSIDNYYVPSVLMVDHGTGYNQYAKVIGYVGATKTLQLELPMAVTLDTTSHITLQPWASSKIESTQYTNIDNKLTTVTNATDTLEASATQIAGYVDTLETSVDAIKAVTDTMPTAANIAAQVRVELTAELAHVMALQNGLTEGQATMLLESYRLLGLDPTRPLVVTKTNRTAGVEISQTITGDANSTTVTRV